MYITARPSKNLFSIFASGEFLLSQVAGKEAEQDFAKTPYFLSVRRQKVNPQAFYDVTLELKEQALHSRMKRMSVDYWQDDRKAIEQEDRYFYRKPRLKNAISLVREVYINMEAYSPETMGTKLRSFMITAIKNGVKVYFLPPKAYRILDVRAAIPHSRLTYGETRNRLNTPVTDDLLEEQQLRGMRYIRNKKSPILFIYRALIGRATKEQDTRSWESWSRYYPEDLAGVFSADLHNASHSRDTKDKMYAAKVQDYMKANGLSVRQAAQQVQKFIFQGN